MSALSSTDRAAEPAILAAIQARPGITSAQMVTDLAIPEYRVRRVLSSAKNRGLVGMFRADQNATWWPAEMVAAAEAAAREAAAPAQRERYLQSQRDYHSALAKRRRAERNASPPLASSPVCSRVDVSAPLPFELSAPASVWQYAGSML